MPPETLTGSRRKFDLAPPEKGAPEALAEKPQAPAPITHGAAREILLEKRRLNTGALWTAAVLSVLCAGFIVLGLSTTGGAASSFGAGAVFAGEGALAMWIVGFFPKVADLWPVHSGPIYARSAGGVETLMATDTSGVVTSPIDE